MFLFKINKKHAQNLGILLVSSLTLIYFIEIFLFSTAETYLSKRIELASQTGVYFDKRTKDEVYKSLNARGISALPSVFPKLFISSNGLILENQERIFPLGGISKATTVHCNESGTWMIIPTDEHGFNNPIGLYSEKLLDVAVIGDSFAYGNCVPEGKDVSSRIRDIFPKTISFGSAGNGPLIELATLKEYVEPLKPRVVLWMYYENDLGNLSSENASPILLKYLDHGFSQNLLAKQEQIDESLRNYIKRAEIEQQKQNIESSVFNSAVYKILVLQQLRQKANNIFYPQLIPVPPLSPPPFADFRNILMIAKERVESWGGELYFVYLPSWVNYSSQLNEEDNLYYREEVLLSVQELEIQIIDFDKVLDNHPDVLSLFPFRMHGHYTDEGYNFLAKEILNHLLD